MTLFEFAYCHDFDGKLQYLAGVAAPERWAFPGDAGLPILWNYVHHTFSRLSEETGDQASAGSKIMASADQGQACFNTGLYTKNSEPVSGLFEHNRNPGKQPWYLKGFYRESDRGLSSFPDLPDRASYFADISDLVLDYRCDIRINRDHILHDESNLERLSETLRNPIAFDGAVSIAKKKVAANYRLAVPQYYEGRIQILIPLGCDPERAEVALVISKENRFYTGHTCLTLKMAYNNARLIAKPDTDWLRPETI